MGHGWCIADIGGVQRFGSCIPQVNYTWYTCVSDVQATYWLSWCYQIHPESSYGWFLYHTGCGMYLVFRIRTLHLCFRFACKMKMISGLLYLSFLGGGKVDIRNVILPLQPRLFEGTSTNRCTYKVQSTGASSKHHLWSRSKCFVYWIRWYDAVFPACTSTCRVITAMSHGCVECCLPRVRM